MQNENRSDYVLESPYVHIGIGDTNTIQLVGSCFKKWVPRAEEPRFLRLLACG